MEKIKVGIVGGTGYTGVELLRLLAIHPGVELVTITSRQAAGTAVADMFPNLRGHIDLNFVEPDTASLKQCEAVFFATPHGAAMSQVPELLDAGVRVIDLSADFRLKDAALWSDWYGQPHSAPELLPEAVYGLPELSREGLAQARLVACAGCYPTAIQLGFIPLIEHGGIDTTHLIADAKTGTTGAGRTAKLGMLLAEAGDSLGAYGITGHRHLPEIRQCLSGLAGEAVDLVFMPHLAPMIRGIHATLYARQTSDVDLDWQAVFEQRYADEPFVDVLPAGEAPHTRSVRGSNMCRIAVVRPQDGDTVVVLSVIDNLTKGSSGQALQCFNLMFGLEETTGLEQIALLP